MVITKHLLNTHYTTFCVSQSCSHLIWMFINGSLSAALTFLKINILYVDMMVDNFFWQLINIFFCRRKLRADISAAFPSLSPDELSELVPNKDELNVVKVYAHKGDAITFYVLHKNPLFFQIEKQLYPTGTKYYLSVILKVGLCWTCLLISFANINYFLLHWHRITVYSLVFALYCLCVYFFSADVFHR